MNRRTFILLFSSFFSLLGIITRDKSSYFLRTSRQFTRLSSSVGAFSSTVGNAESCVASTANGLTRQSKQDFSNQRYVNIQGWILTNLKLYYLEIMKSLTLLLGICVFFACAVSSFINQGPDLSYLFSGFRMFCMILLFDTFCSNIPYSLSRSIILPYSYFN